VNLSGGKDTGANSGADLLNLCRNRSYKRMQIGKGFFVESRPKTSLLLETYISYLYLGLMEMKRGQDLRMYACVYVCMHARTFVCMYVCMYVCLFVCMHI
jgi:hypothetical protein